MPKLHDHRIEKAIAAKFDLSEEKARDVVQTVTQHIPSLVKVRDKISVKKYTARKKNHYVDLLALTESNGVTARRIELRAISALLQALRSSESTHFTVTIDRHANTATCEPIPAPSQQDEFEKAIAEALERGKASSAHILAGPEMLTSDQLAELLNVSRETVNRLRLRHDLIALQGVKRGFKYPDWQIMDGRPLEGLPQLHAVMDNSPWAVYRFLLEQHDSLGGRRALDLLRKGRLEDVLLAAEALSRGTG